MSEDRRPTRPPAGQARGDPGKAVERVDRERRLSAALRANLRRRKEQARAQGTVRPEDRAGEKPPRSA